MDDIPFQKLIDLGNFLVLDELDQDFVLVEVECEGFERHVLLQAKRLLLQAKKLEFGIEGAEYPDQLRIPGALGDLQVELAVVFVHRRKVAAFNRLLPLSRVRQRYAHQIERAGLRFELSADEFIAIKIAGLLALTAVGLVVYFAVMPKAALNM